MRNINKVEALAASWIEILIFPAFRAILQSKPLRLRGLKFLFQISKNGLKNVEALAASWIEILLAQLSFVEALAASWIEIWTNVRHISAGSSRSPCGFVD